MIDAALLDILQCPDCASRMRPGLRCSGCSRDFSCSDEILELMPRREIPLPAAYSDPDYVAYQRMTREKEDYFYHNRNPLIHWVQAAGYRRIRNIVKNRKALMLETGCGTGALLTVGPDSAGGSLVMLDNDPEALKLIPRRHTLKGVIQGTSYVLPFVDASFDIIISHAQLEHLYHLDMALGQMRRVIRPGGTCLVSVPTEGGLFWNTGRRLTSARYFSKKMGIDYLKVNRIDHCNTIYRIDRSVRKYFTVHKRILFPFRIPVFGLNLICTYILFPKTRL